MVTAIEQSKDPLITECLSLLSDPGYLSRNNVPSDTLSLLEAAKKSTSEIVPISKMPSKAKLRPYFTRSMIVFGTVTLTSSKSSPNLKISYL